MAGYLSDQTTVLSNVSLTGQLLAAGVTSGATSGTQSVGTLTVTSVFSVGGAAQLSSTLTVGGAATITGALKAGSGAAMKFISAITVPVVATTVAATKSTLTEATVSSVSSTDVVVTGAFSSGLSNGVVVQSWCTTDGKLVINFSNVSTAAANQIAGNLSVVVIRI